MSRRQVKSTAKALARTNRPVIPTEYTPPGWKELARKAAKDGLHSMLSGMGTPRDKRTHTHYGFFRPLTLYECQNAYTGSWLIGKIIRAVAEDMTRKWIEMSWDGSDKEMAPVQDAEDAFAVRAKVLEALTWTRVFGGCVIIVGIEGEDLTTPLDLDSVKKDSLRYLHVLDRWRISWDGIIDEELGSPNFGLPAMYIVAESSVRVHWSRVIRFDGRPLPYFAFKQNMMWHDSEIRPVLETVQDYDAGKNSVAALMLEAAVDIIRADGLAEMLTTEDGEAQAQKRYLNAVLGKSVFRTLLLDKETEEYEQKTVPFNQGCVDALRQLMVDVCGASDVPITRLFGQSPGGLGSTGEGEERNYYDHIESKQNSQLRPQLMRLYGVLIRHAIGRWPENFKMGFCPLRQMTDKERSEIDLNRAKRDDLNIKNGVITPGLAMREAKEDQVYRTAEDEDVKMAEELSSDLAEHEATMRETSAEGAKKALEDPPAGREDKPAA